MMVRGSMNCPICKKSEPLLKKDDAKVLIYIFDSDHNDIRFYPSYYLNNLPPRKDRYDIEFKKITSDDKPDYYDYLISCPLCGEFTMLYENVPKDWDIYLGTERGWKLIVVPIIEISSLKEIE